MVELPDRLAHLIANLLKEEPGQYSLAIQDLAGNEVWPFRPARLRAASLIKIFIMIEAFRQAELGRLKLCDWTAVTDDVRVGGAGPLSDFPSGVKITWLEVIELMITESDNAATNLLIKALGMEAVNAQIARLGCKDTVLSRKMMDFASAEAGRENYTTPSEVTAVLAKIYRRDCLGSEMDEAMLDILKNQQDKVKLPLLLPPGTVVAHKTGELDKAEHDAGIIFTPAGDYVLSIMSDNLPDNLRGQEVIARLSRLIYDEFNQKTPAY